MGTMIARVCDIYCDPRNGNATVFTMEPFLNIELLSDALEAHDFHIKDIVSIIAQVALALYILDTQLDMNHRDLKTTNILIEATAAAAAVPGSLSGTPSYRECLRSNPLLENIKYSDHTFSIYGGYNVKLVDFGFACTGNRRRSFINAGNFFPMSDPCPKTGRDIFQLLTTMFLCTRFQTQLESSTADAEKLAGLFRRWLKIPNNDYIGFLKTIGSKSIDWVYLMLGSDKFYAPNCESFRVLQDISTTFSDIVIIK
jgi:serine/threonine protein kinase